MTLIEKANFWLVLVQRVLPATESGAGTTDTDMSMNDHKMSIYGPDECDPENFALS